MAGKQWNRGGNGAYEELPVCCMCLWPDSQICPGIRLRARKAPCYPVGDDCSKPVDLRCRFRTLSYGRNFLAVSLKCWTQGRCSHRGSRMKDDLVNVWAIFPAYRRRTSRGRSDSGCDLDYEYRGSSDFLLGEERLRGLPSCSVNIVAYKGKMCAY